MSPSRAPHNARAATRESILQAALRRFARYGPRKTTMDEVAREAGCSRATVYAHFSGKDGLYRGLLEHETRSFLDQVEAAVGSSDSAPGKLQEIMRATQRIYADRPVLHGALTGGADNSFDRVARPAVRTHEKQVVGMLRRALEDGVREGTFRELDSGAVAYLMYQLGRVLVQREVSGRQEFALKRILRVMSDLLARGIAAKAP
jgi:AcrR family transcriptional regulator